MPRISRSYQQLIDQINRSLEAYDQRLRIAVLQNGILILNNGTQIPNGNHRRRFFNRAESVSFLPYMDQIYHHTGIDESAVKQIKSSLAKSAQKKADMTAFLAYANTKGRPSPRKGKKSNIIPWSSGKTKQTDVRLQSISQKMSGENNPSRTHHDTIFTAGYRAQHSATMKQKILHNEFTPITKNSMTHFEATCRGNKYRSSWEAAFAFQNPTYEYETLRIEYQCSSTGKLRIYIVDFYDPISRIAYEIKPIAHLTRQNFKDKEQALKMYCTSHAMTYQILSEFNVVQLVSSFSSEDFAAFDPHTAMKLRKLHSHEINKKTRNH